MHEVWILTEAFQGTQEIFSSHGGALNRLLSLKDGVEEVPQKEENIQMYRTVWKDSEGGVWEIRRHRIR